MNTDFSSLVGPLGLVMYNMSSQEWFNLSSASYSYDGFAGEGVAQFIPKYGVGGLLVSIGGWNTADRELATMQFVSLYDPHSQQWESQLVSGEYPDQTMSACMVGIEGDEDTYEVCRLKEAHVVGWLTKSRSSSYMAGDSTPTSTARLPMALFTFYRYLHFTGRYKKRHQRLAVTVVSLLSTTRPPRSHLNSQFQIPATWWGADKWLW
jgi:hypothetical protein